MVHQGEPASTADRRARPRGMAARTLPTVIAVSALIGLAGCGSTQGNSAGPPATAGPGHATQTAAAQKASAGVPLCAAAPTLDHVVVSLTAARFREILPARLTIRDAPRVQALAAALCALPPSPSGLHCPASLGGSLRLVFAAGERGFRTVGIQDSGCPSVTGLGPARQWSWSSLSGRLLSAAAGGKGRLIPGTHPSSVPTA